MNTVLAALDGPLMHQVGWTLLHSLWQGALVGMVFVVLRFALRRCSANSRYVAGCVCLALLAMAPVLTALHGPTPLGAAGPEAPGMSAAAGAPGSGFSAASLGRSYGGRGTDWSLQGGADFFAWLAPVLGMVWLLGVTVFSVRLTRNCWWVSNLRTRGSELAGAAWREALDDLRRRLGVSRPVRLLKSALVEVPTVIGWVRPVILLPAAMLSGLTPAELEAILAHELAHVRRLDYLVNAFQCLVETLMFYHPATWWISGCIREERENCCDDLVVELCGDRLGYARALATLEGLRAELPGWAFAASGGSLLNRIRRLVGRKDDNGPATARQVSGLALMGIGLVLIVLGIRLAVTPTIYRSTARIRVERDQADAGGPAEQRGSTFSDPYFIQTESEVIQSEAVLGKVIENLDLNQQWGIKHGSGERLKTWETMGLLRRKIELTPVRNSSLINISVDSDNPDEAAKIANAVAEAFRTHRLEQRMEVGNRRIKALEERLLDQEKKVEDAQQRVDRLRVELNISDAMATADGPSPLMTAETLRKLESLRIESKAEYVRQATLLERMKRMGADLGPDGLAQALPTCVPDAQLGSLLDQLSLAEQRLLGQEKQFGPKHVDVISSQAMVDDLLSTGGNK